MNTHRSFLFFAVVGLALLPGPAVGAETPTSSEKADAAKPYTLFMGADVSIEQKKEFHRVRDVSGDKLMITVKGEPTFVPVTGPISFKVDSALKVTATSAVVENFKYERAYTALNDPNKKFAREQGAAGSMAASAAAEYNQYGAQLAVSQAKGIWGNPRSTVDTMRDTGGKTVALAEHNAAMADAKTNAAFAAEAGRFNQVGTYSGRLQGDLSQELFDAIEVTFDVATSEPLNRAYVVMLATFRDADAKPNEFRKWIYAKELGAIPDHPRQIHILQGGFPPGFELKELQVRFYNAGREVATNLSPKRVPLTSDEAFQYIMIDYLGSHKKATATATVALGKFPAELLGELTSPQRQVVYYVSVSKEGIPTRVCLDPDCGKAVAEPVIASFLKGLRFKPALDKGQPVDSVIPLKLAELSQQL